MSVPVFRAASAKASGTTGATAVGLPAGLVANDIVLLIATTIAGGSISVTTNGSIGTWNLVTNLPIDVTSGEKLYVWWGRYSSGSTGPSVTPGSDHVCAGTVAYSGCITDSTVINASPTGSETTSELTLSCLFFLTRRIVRTESRNRLKIVFRFCKITRAQAFHPS